MILKKVLRQVLLVVLAVIVALVLFIGVSVAPVDRTPAWEFDSYKKTMARLGRLDTLEIPGAAHGFSIGYAKVNLTPPERTVVAGAGKGKLYTEILDSIYVRTIVIGNGSQKVAVVSADLLIIPPAVTKKLETQLPEIGFSLKNTYLGATHSHHSIGNWAGGVAGFIYGFYRKSVVDFIADRIVQSIEQATLDMQPSSVKAGLIPVPLPVDNRLIDGGPEDSLLRVIEIHRKDSSKLLFMSYTAHATCLYSKDVVLSRDYPGKLVDSLEQQGYDFVMFMAGAVGSHGAHPPAFGRSCIDWMAGQISSAFFAGHKSLQPVRDSTLMMIRVPLLLSEPQVKILPDWKVRAWLFRSALGEYPVYLTAFRMGDVVLLGAPCDFSGEFDPPIDSLASSMGLLTIPTSFNGGYIGYVTPAQYYDVHHYETQLMNWYAPGTGDYIQKGMEKLLDAVNE